MNKPLFNNRWYDILKWITILFLPAVGTLYGRLAGIWGLPFGPEIRDTIIAVQACLGVLLGISAIQYKQIDENAAC